MPNGSRAIESCVGGSTMRGERETPSPNGRRAQSVQTDAHRRPPKNTRARNDKDGVIQRKRCPRQVVSGAKIRVPSRPPLRSPRQSAPGAGIAFPPPRAPCAPHHSACGSLPAKKRLTWRASRSTIPCRGGFRPANGSCRRIKSWARKQNVEACQSVCTVIIVALTWANAGMNPGSPIP